MTSGGPPVRIGTAERNAAMRALDQHLEAGRLTVDEYGERSATAANATTADQLAALFVDLPAPHPELPGVPAPAAPLPVAGSSAPPAVPDGGGSLQAWAPKLMGIVPLVAVALFFLTKSWVWFLLIPIAGVLLGASRRQR